MFDVGMSELGLIGVVALIVIGPEQLPKVARTVGHVTGKLRRYVADVKSEISREMDMADLKRVQSDLQQTAHSIENTVREEINAVEQQLQVETPESLPEPLPDPIAELLSSPEVLPAITTPDALSADEVPQVDERQADLFNASSK